MKRFAVLSSIVLAACGGGGSDSSTSGSPATSSAATAPTPVMNQSVGGIWNTQYTVASGANVGDTIDGIAIATETGSFFFAGRNTANGCATVGFGQLTANGIDLTGNETDAIVSYTTINGINPTCTYPDGTTSASGLITGTLTQRSSFTITDSATTSSGAVLASDSTTWTYNQLYAQSASLASIAGNYSDGGDILNINASGVIFEQDPASGCVLNGQVSIPNASYNAYEFSINFSSCTGTDAVFNGQTGTGLAYLDTSTSPATLNGGLKISVNGAVFVELYELPVQ
jgi:hypothetical protein